jgi:heme-degrading monooxygenase HmoA
LKTLLVQQPGFISVERFESLMEEGKLLSLSFWESEQAIVNWRSQLDHIEAQKEGKEKLFERYRIRVVKIERDYSFSADTP